MVKKNAITKTKQEESHLSNTISDPEKWVDLYGNLLYRFALARLRDPVLAEDAVQETLLSAFKGRENFSGRSTEQTWLVGILKHKIIDHFRKMSREVNLNEDTSIEDIGEDAFNENGRWKNGPVSWSLDSSKILEQKEFLEILKQCLTDLPGRLANAFVMRELEGLDSQEICKVIDVSSTNLWVILHRARQRLRGCLEINWFGQRSEKG